MNLEEGQAASVVPPGIACSLRSVEKIIVLLIGIIMSISPRPSLDKRSWWGFSQRLWCWGVDLTSVAKWLPICETLCIMLIRNFSFRAKWNCSFVSRVRSHSVVKSSFFSLTGSSGQEVLIILQIVSICQSAGCSQFPFVLPYMLSKAGVWFNTEGNFYHCRTLKPLFWIFLCCDCCQ